VHAEQDCRHLDEDRSEQEQTDCGGQPLVPDGVQPSLALLIQRTHESEV
jgi:hypothetical protein